MRLWIFSVLRRLRKEEDGQSGVLIVVTLVAVMALAAAGLETGHVYYAYRILQASTNAAALAAGEAMPNIGTSSDTISSGSAWGNANGYSSMTGAENASSMLSSVTVTPTFSCSSTVTSLNVFCEENSGTGSACVGATSSSWCNEVTVTQSAKVNLWFGGLVGFRSFNLTAVAQAAMAGGHPPYNIAVIIDTTESMTGSANSNDGCPSSAPTQIGCAVYGLQQMLLAMYPCLSSGNCSSASEEADGVALFVFPAVEVTSSKNYTTDDTTCPTTKPPIVPYSFEDWTGTNSTSNLFLPNTSSTYGSSNAGTYQIEVSTSTTNEPYGFDVDYKQTDYSTGLLASDALAIASGAGGGSCKGLQAPGGEGTYYAQVIYAAQAALLEQQSYMSSQYNQATQNIMIILSDGSATACNTQTSTGNDCSTGSSSQILADNCPSITTANGNPTSANPCLSPYTGQPLNGTSYSYKNASNQTVNVQPAGYESPDYPSALGECGQAVQAAQAATKAGTTVYTVAMGAETSSSCTTDQTYTITNLTNGAQTWPGGSYSKQACNAIAAMASTTSTFYSDAQKGCTALGQNQEFETMASIFTDVAKHLSTSRLIPAGSP